MSAPRFWRFNRERYTLTGAQCTNCGQRTVAPRLVCPRCHSESEETYVRANIHKRAANGNQFHERFLHGQLILAGFVGRVRSARRETQAASRPSMHYPTRRRKKPAQRA